MEAGSIYNGCKVKKSDDLKYSYPPHLECKAKIEKASSFSINMEIQVNELNGKLTDLYVKANNIHERLYGQMPESSVSDNRAVNELGTASQMNTTFTDMHRAVQLISDMLDTF